MELRTVGTEFDITYPPSLASSVLRFRRYTYRVVRHDTAQRFEGDEVGQTVEVIEPIAGPFDTPAQYIRYPDGSVGFEPLGRWEAGWYRIG